ncbi:MAG: DUF502 domain-containing protein [Phycisphaeraceae bacterium]
MPDGRRETFFENFKRFFIRGLAIVMPTILTVWIIIAAYNFLDNTIAEPINQGIRNLVLRFSNYPTASPQEREEYRARLDPRERRELDREGKYQSELEYQTRKDKLLYIWRRSLYPLDLIGVVLVIVIVYLAGGILGSFIGNQIYYRGERMLQRLPLVRSVYPAVKQLTDYFFGDKEQKKRFQRVVAVEYPRKGMWSIGLVTGGSWDVVDRMAGKRCVTVYLPSTPMGTGYAVIVPAEEIINLPITIDEALKRILSGGVLGPTVDGTLVLGGDTVELPDGKKQGDDEAPLQPAGSAPRRK